MRQTALMDFLRDFRQPEPAAEAGGWQPTAEQVLGADTLAIAGTMPAVAAAPRVQAVAVAPLAVAASEPEVPPAPEVFAAPVRPAGFGPPRRPGSVPPGALGHLPPAPGADLMPDGYPVAAYPADPQAVPQHWAPSGPQVAVGAWAPPGAWQTPANLPPPPGFPPGSWSPPGPPPGPAAGKRRGRARVIAAVVAAAALVAGVAAVILRPGGPSYPRAWDPRVAPIATFVQGDRGLTWKHPVEVRFLAPPAFVKAINAGNGQPDPSAERDLLATARALGLASGSVDLGAAGQDLQDNSVIGLYVPKDKTVYVRGATLTPFVRVTLAHELTHALQDEYFPLDRLKNGPTDDESATTALIEGDAVRVEADYARAMSEADRNSYADAAQSGSRSANSANQADSVPAFLADSEEFPYDFGPTFVESLVREGGNALVDSAMHHPPSLDGQIVDPTSYQIGLPVSKVTLPGLPAGARVVQPAGGLGEVPLVEALGYEVGFTAAWSAVQGWTADRFEAYRVDGRVCADVAVLDDSVSDAGHLLGAARQWAAALPGARVTQSGATVNMTSCDPGPKWRPRSSVDPYPALAARSAVIGDLEKAGHLSAVTSSCIADDLLSQVGPATLTAAAGAASSSDPAVRAVLAHEHDDLTACS